MAREGFREVTEAYYLVADYLNKKALSEMGYTFEGETLSDFDAKVYLAIRNEFVRLDQREMEKRGSKHRD
jgi:hypothetical protein